MAWITPVHAGVAGGGVDEVVRIALGGAPDARAQAAGGDGGAGAEQLVGDLTGEWVLDAHGARRRVGAAEADVAAGVDGERR